MVKFFEHRAANGTTYTKYALHILAHSLFRVRIVVIAAPLDKGWDPIGADTTLLVNGNTFLQFFPILQSCLHKHPPCVERHGPQAVSCEVHIPLFGQLDMVAAC